MHTLSRMLLVLRVRDGCDARPQKLLYINVMSSCGVCNCVGMA